MQEWRNNMSKVYITSILKNKNTNEIIKNNINGILKNNIINYIDNNTKVNIKINDSIFMTRKDENSEIIFEFKKEENTKCIYKIYNKELYLNIYTNNIILKDNYLEIDYNIEEEKLNFRIEW